MLDVEKINRNRDYLNLPAKSAAGKEASSLNSSITVKLSQTSAQWISTMISNFSRALTFKAVSSSSRYERTPAAVRHGKN